VFRKLFSKIPEPLTGAPPVRRMKTFSSESGYVYQYVFEGRRPIPKPESVEFVFSASADRKTWNEIGVRVESGAVREWESAHGRTLSTTEWYAIAKLALFLAFDQRPTPRELTAHPVIVRHPEVASIMERLDSGMPPE